MAFAGKPSFAGFLSIIILAMFSLIGIAACHWFSLLFHFSPDTAAGFVFFAISSRSLPFSRRLFFFQLIFHYWPFSLRQPFSLLFAEFHFTPVLTFVVSFHFLHRLSSLSRHISIASFSLSATIAAAAFAIVSFRFRWFFIFSDISPAWYFFISFSFSFIDINISVSYFHVAWFWLDIFGDLLPLLRCRHFLLLEPVSLSLFIISSPFILAFISSLLYWFSSFSLSFHTFGHYVILRFRH